MGDALEEILEKAINNSGHEQLRRYAMTRDGEHLSFEQHFSGKGKVVLVGQKVRDDHDSTKKRGQKSNFEKN